MVKVTSQPPPANVPVPEDRPLPPGPDEGIDVDFHGPQGEAQPANSQDKSPEYNGVASNEKDEKEEEYKCPECEKEITAEQVKFIIEQKDKKGNVIALSADDEKHLTDILTYLNKYRKDYKLDTCLRKAHFIAQAAAECGRFSTFEEGLNYGHKGLRGNFSKYFVSSFKINDYFNPKHERYNCFTKAEIIDLLAVEYKKKDEKDKKDIQTLLEGDYKELTVDETLLYGRVDEKNGVLIKDDATLKISVKKHDAFKIKWPSRVYGDRMSNGKETGHDGYRFRGRGIIQLTGKENYTKFGNHRKEHPFPDDTTGYIDFTANDSEGALKGNYDKISDTGNLMYAVQSAVVFWAITTSSLPGLADEDDIKQTTYRVNGGYKHLGERNDFIKRARLDDGLKVFTHYRNLHTNGNKSQKDTVIKNLKLLSESRTKKDEATDKMIELKDPEGEKLKNELAPETTKPQAGDQPGAKKEGAPAVAPPKKK
ncbi:glycoside hydrolase family 19 protein [Chitinophaga qingshengii]|uniref:Chitinase n=1 Tax=Chitinophaga qingshengii TaxID=1569794 RepID=A0ABR7TF52_9BACT|nr:hypothetical protein [Chitinophaga qingshengii]MBC9928943.1 hypothetical protein [Chitinophaga qingshengii]